MNEFVTVIDQLSQTPKQIASLVGEMSLEQGRFKPSPRDFSVLENICHLRDIEIEAYGVRIERILTEDKPILADINGAQLALERDYNSEDLESALASFTAVRAQNVERLRSTSKQQMIRMGVLEGVGEISLGRLLEMMNQHDEEHLVEIRGLSRRHQPSAAEPGS